MNRFPLPLTRLVHENLAIVMCHAYSRKPLTNMMQENFGGEWKYLRKAIFEISAEQAYKSCLELALFLRMVDDEYKISAYKEATKSNWNCGKLILKNDSKKTLKFRDVANKIIHSSNLDWKFSDSDEPILVCFSREEEKWVRAEINLVPFAAICGGLMS